MKRVLYLRLIIAFSLFPAINLLAAENGLLVSQGVGISPIYIEEIIDQNSLFKGSAGTVLNTSTKLGLVFNDVNSLYLLIERNWYPNSAGQFITTGLLGLGSSYFLPDFHGVYLMAGAGLASKIVLGGNSSASGTGFMLGFGRSITSSLALEVGYNYLGLTAVAVDPTLGDSESISSAHINLSYNWN